MKIGLISDTHSYLDPRVADYFAEVDEIWHAGDFGTLELSDELAQLKPLRGVYGNIDGKEIRAVHPLHLRFEMEGLDIWMTHIGGYPGRYEAAVRSIIYEKPPAIFICGHSHILKVIRDKKLGCICINPGAAGHHGFHKVRTLIRFELLNGKIANMEVIELGSRGRR